MTETGNQDHRLGLRLAARTAAAFQLRTDLRLWLTARSIDEEAILDILVAANEAFTNAVTHACQPRSIAIYLDASITDDIVEVVLRDHGRWRDDQRSSDSAGLGLPLMQALMDTVDIRAGSDGTTIRLRRRINASDRAGESGAPYGFDDRVRLLRRNPIFAPLATEMLEPLAAQLIPFSASTGETIIREGDHGELIYLIAEGQLEVSVDSRHVATLGPNDHVGEIAPIREVPRTATIVTRTPAELYALTRDHFLAAVNSNSASSDNVQHLIRSRLAELEDVLGQSA